MQYLASKLWVTAVMDYKNSLICKTKFTGNYNLKVDNILHLERLELYFDANAVEEGRRVPVLLTVIGPAFDILACQV